MIVEHGGNGRLLAEKNGNSSEKWIDFSANINPLGVSTSLRQVLVDSIDRITEYPDITNQYEKDLLREHHGNQDLEILLSNGAVGLFYELAQTLKPKRLLILSPTFMEYEKAFHQEGTEILYHHLTAPHFTWTVEGLLSDIDQLEAGDVVLLCNPNNPTGSVVPVSQLLEIAKKLLERNIHFILDEAFIDFLEDEEKYSFVPYLSEFTNTIVVRSLTKFYAIPGLRLGYALGKHPCLTKINERRAPWTINALALQALPVILKDQDYQAQTLKWLQEEKDFLYRSLETFSALTVLKPSVNYIFFKYTGSKDLREELWRYNIFIRSCSNYRNLSSDYYRVAIRSREENTCLLVALKAILGGHE